MLSHIHMFQYYFFYSFLLMYFCMRLASADVSICIHGYLPQRLSVSLLATICVCLVLLFVTVPVFPTFLYFLLIRALARFVFFFSFGLLAYLSACFCLPLSPFCCAYLYK